MIGRGSFLDGVAEGVEGAYFGPSMPGTTWRIEMAGRFLGGDAFSTPRFLFKLADADASLLLILAREELPGPMLISSELLPLPLPGLTILAVFAYTIIRFSGH